MKNGSPFTHGLEYLAYLAFRAFKILIFITPITVGFRIGHILGSCAYWLVPPARKLTHHNLRIAYGDELSENARRRLARRHFGLLVANMFSSLKLPSLSREKIHERIDLEFSPEVFDLMVNGENGWLATISHMGCWEVFAQIGDVVPGRPLATVYRPLPNRYIDNDFKKSRARFGVALFDRHRNLMKARTFLKNGGGVAVLVDQHAGDPGVWTPFFGRLASTSPLAASLAIRAKVPIIPIAVHTTGIARWKVLGGAPLETEGAESGPLTAEITSALETQIRMSPADWLWSHDRWKTPRPRFLFARHHRGVAYPADFSGKLKPFRILIVSPEDPFQAHVSMPALEIIKPYRPDAEISVLTTETLEHNWRDHPDVTEVLTTTFCANRQQLPASGALDRFDATFLFSPDRNLARALRDAKLPRLTGPPEMRAFTDKPKPMTTTDRDSPQFYIDIVTNAGARPKDG